MKFFIRNKSFKKAVLLFSVFFLMSFSVHKFYMSTFLAEYVPQKKMLQITARIFVDDLNKALEKKNNEKLFLGTNKESEKEINYLRKYLSDNFQIRLDGKKREFKLMQKEYDADVLICYIAIKDVEVFREIDITNTILMDAFSEQQNIVHVNNKGEKKSMLFTNSNRNIVLKF